jgi:hypothetical protein
LLIEERKAKAVAKARNVAYSIIQVAPFHGYLSGKLARDTCLALMELDFRVLNRLRQI